MAQPHTAFFETAKAGGLDRADALRRLEILAQLMDNAFMIPGLNRRVGLAPKTLIARMVGNVALDGLVGLIPFAGDAFDAVFKANIRNVRLLREYLATTGADLAKPAYSDHVIDAEYRVVNPGGGRR
jgi:Domain of unknown function (DUF4112)